MKANVDASNVNDAKKDLTDGKNGLNNKANVDASNIGNNLTVAPIYKKDASTGKEILGSDGKPIVDEDATKVATEKARNLVDKYDAIGIEDISVKAMAKRKKGGKFSFGKSVADNGWNMFTNILEYKLAWQGKQLVKIGKWYPSSQLCHVCGFQNDATKDVSVREWDCPKCGSHHNRDKNAAINIREEARRISA